MAHTACSDPATPLSLPSTFVVVPVMCKWQLPVLRDASHTGVQHHPATAWPNMPRTHSSSSTYTLTLLLIGTGLSGLCCWQSSLPFAYLPSSRQGWAAEPEIGHGATDTRTRIITLKPAALSRNMHWLPFLPHTWLTHPTQGLQHLTTSPAAWCSPSPPLSPMYLYTCFHTPNTSKAPFAFRTGTGLLSCSTRNKMLLLITVIIASASWALPA